MTYTVTMANLLQITHVHIFILVYICRLNVTYNLKNYTSTLNYCCLYGVLLTVLTTVVYHTMSA